MESLDTLNGWNTTLSALLAERGPKCHCDIQPWRRGEWDWGDLTQQIERAIRLEIEPAFKNRYGVQQINIHATSEDMQMVLASLADAVVEHVLNNPEVYNLRKVVISSGT